MANKVKITINSKTLEVEKGLYLIEAAEQLGIEIPTLCHHEQLEPYGACRLCTVEVKKGDRSRYVTACNYQADEGQIIETDTERIVQIRKLIIESLLALNPNVQILKMYAQKYGITVPRFEKGDEDCIKCYLCLRICEEVVGANAICFAGRGVDREILTPFATPSDDCIACGACVWICPTHYVKVETEKLESFRSLPGRDRFCRYSLMGLSKGAICANSFRCWKCEVEQTFLDQLETHPIFLGKNRKMSEIEDFKRTLNDLRE